MRPSSGYLRKPFDAQLHEENDGPAKEAVMRYIERNWFLGVVEGGKYDVDLIIIDKGQEVGFGEVECRHNWVRNFPYQTVNVPYSQYGRTWPRLSGAGVIQFYKPRWSRTATSMSQPVRSSLLFH